MVCMLDQLHVRAGASMSPHHAPANVQGSRKTSVRSPLHPQGVHAPIHLMSMTVSLELEMQCKQCPVLVCPPLQALSH